MLPIIIRAGQHKPSHHRTNTLTITNITERIQNRDGVAVVVYTTPGCVQCVPTIRQLKKAGIVFTEVDITTDETAQAYVTGPRDQGGLGYLSAPVVVTSTPDGDIDWNGLRPDLIKLHITDLANAA